MKATKLTVDIISKINPKTILYAEYAEAGAMGACLTARIYTLEDGVLKYYLADETVNSEEDEAFLVWTEACARLRSWNLDKILIHAYGGFGNHAYKAPKIDFSRDDDNATFIYEENGKTYKLKASCSGVYDHVVSEFATRDVPIESLEEYLRANTDRLTVSERMFFENYLIQQKRTDKGMGWFDMTALDYLKAVTFIEHLNGVYILNDNDRYETEMALQKYRLKYVVDKLGWNKLNNIINKLAVKGATDLFAQINKAIGEDISLVYATLERVKTERTSIEATDDNSIESLFDRPVLVDFTKTQNAKILKDILERPGNTFNPDGKVVAFYLANYIFNEDKFSLADALPAVVHIIGCLPNDDFNHTHTDELFWLCGSIIDMAWRYLEEDEAIQKKYRDLVYEIFWPRVGSLWPILHHDEFEFKNRATENMLNDAFSFVMSLKDITERNMEIKSLLDRAGDEIGYKAGALGRCAFEYSLRDLKPEEEFEKILKEIEPQDYGAFLTYPQGMEEAEILIKELFRTDEKARITGVSRLGVFEAVLMTPNTIGVGEYLLNYIDNHFEDFVAIISQEVSELDTELLDVLADFFVAMSKGATEENEFAPLKSIKDKLEKLGCDKEKLDSAGKYARHHRRTILFQRTALQKLF